MIYLFFFSKWHHVSNQLNFPTVLMEKSLRLTYDLIRHLTNKNLTSKMLFKFPPLAIITEKSLHTGIVDAWYSSHPHYIQLELLQIILHFSFLTWLMRWGDHCCVTRITTVDEKLCIPSQKVLHHLYYHHFYTQSVIY